MNSIIIDKNNLLHNYKIIKKIAKQAKICAVVKANAYGHDIKIISDILKEYVDYFAVSTIDEGINLRNYGITNNILILGYILSDQMELAIENNLEICIGNQDQLKLLISIAKSKKTKAKIHLKKNSGLSRYGYDKNLELSEILDLIESNINYVEFVGFFTHFVITDEKCEDNIEKQNQLFQKDVSIIHNRGFHPIIHAAASTTLFLTKKYQYDMVRIGMAFYGFCGFGENLRKVLSVKSKIVAIREINHTQAIGYGGIKTFKADKQIAVIPIGYGYGIFSKLSGKSFVLINGEQCQIVGNMSMDCMYVDITHLANKVKVGSEVMFIGKQNNKEITATDHAQKLKIYSCEILTHLNTNRFNKKIKV